MLSEDIKNQIKSITQSIFHDVVSYRRWIHQHPELSFQEKKTSDFICKILKKNNISYSSNIAGYGVVATIKCNNPSSQVIGLITLFGNAACPPRPFIKTYNSSQAAIY